MRALRGALAHLERVALAPERDVVLEREDVERDVQERHGRREHDHLRKPRRVSDRSLLLGFPGPSAFVRLPAPIVTSPARTITVEGVLMGYRRTRVIKGYSSTHGTHWMQQGVLEHSHYPWGTGVLAYRIRVVCVYAPHLHATSASHALQINHNHKSQLTVNSAGACLCPRRVRVCQGVRVRGVCVMRAVWAWVCAQCT